MRQFHGDRVSVYEGDCLETMRQLPDGCVDSVITDPPYGIKFMGKAWDHGVPGVEFWVEALRVLKPGGHLIAFGGTRTYHRLAVAVEDAGFEVRDMLAFLHGKGIGLGMDVSKKIDEHLGAEREVIGKKGGRHAYPKNDFRGGKLHHGGAQETGAFDAITAPATSEAAAWEGWKTRLKPAMEPAVLARKPFKGTVVENVLAHGTGAMNIGECRIGGFVNTTPSGMDRLNAENHERGYRPNAYGRDGEASAERRYADNGATSFAAKPGPRGGAPEGRYPANVLHDGSDEVAAVFPVTKPSSGRARVNRASIGYGGSKTEFVTSGIDDNGGSVLRFWYGAKASAKDRCGSKHPTVKNVNLMAYMCRLVTPPGGVILDPFAGSGTTGQAALDEGFNVILCEREAEYVDDIVRRMSLTGVLSEVA